LELTEAHPQSPEVQIQTELTQLTNQVQAFEQKFALIKHFKSQVYAQIKALDFARESTNPSEHPSNYASNPAQTQADAQRQLMSILDDFFRRVEETKAETEDPVEVETIQIEEPT
jgi:hypothetical protein